MVTKKNFEWTLISVNELDVKRWTRTYIHGRLVASVNIQTRANIFLS